MASNASSKTEGLNLRVTHSATLKAFRERCAWLTDHRLTYKQVASYVDRSTGWVAYAVAGRWDKIKVTALHVKIIGVIYSLESNKANVKVHERILLEEAMHHLTQAQDRLVRVSQSVARRK